MFEYILHFYTNYTVLFYILLTITVILEWPITILALSLVAPTLSINFFIILLFSFLWEFLWDTLHYLFWKFFKTKVLKKDFSIIKKIEERLKWHNLMDKLIVIKYTPPITSLWLLYLWYTKTDFKIFLKKDIVLCLFSAVFITSIWYNFWHLFKNQTDLKYLIILFFLSFIVFYFLFRTFTKYLIKKIYE